MPIDAAKRPSSPSRRAFLRSAAAATALACFPGRLLFSRPSFDLLIQGGTVYDGTGGPPFRADVGIIGDTIAAVGRLDGATAGRRIAADGLAVAPGFIDIHSHSDTSILGYPTAESRLCQGITTEVTGNCGHSAAPLFGNAADERRQRLQQEYALEANWSDVGSYFQLLENLSIAVNHALLVGHGTLRRNVIGMENRPARDDELAAMQSALEQALEQGAWGLSTGLEYTPGRYTPTDEIVALARVVARHGALYASHIRNEEKALLSAVNEAIHIGRQSGARVQISHLKAAGKPNWFLQEGALYLIEGARRDGISVLADAYPYAAYSTGLTLFLDPEVLEGGTEAMLQRIADPALRPKIRDAVIEHMRWDPGGPELVVIAEVRSDKNRWTVGRRLDEIAREWQSDAGEAVLRLLEEERGEVSFVGHGMSEANVERVLAHPLVMLSTDGYSLAPRGRALAARPHPRSYGSMARFLGHYVRDRGLMDLAAAVHKMTAMPADQLGLRDRGRLAKGMKADVVLFDPGAVADRATFAEPHRFPQGIPVVLVNGRIAVENGKPTGVRAGRVLRRG